MTKTKRLVLTRKWHNMTFDIQCLVSQTVRDLWPDKLHTVALMCLLTLVVLMISSPLIVRAQGGFESWRPVNMTDVSDSCLTIGMYGVGNSSLTINSVIVIPELTDIRVYPISCSFGLLRPGDIQSTDYAFTLYNASNVTASVTIAVAGDWHGVTNWTHSDTCTPGVNTAGLIAKVEDDNGSHTEVIVKKVEPYNYLANNLTPGSTIDFALEIHAPTQFTDYSPKKNTIYITVSEA